ncbi:AAA family ATPase [Plesiocystis pacifica]|uniref:AAA family ATPase n=1 Tax=Plesiocystis pacifica TaxID=191768 RepID=UPI0012F800EA|nr:AAA family ATPase [Plesiocystis pacifica]
MAEALAVRSSIRRPRTHAAQGSSCDLLIELAARSGGVAEILGEVGVEPKSLPELRDQIKTRIEPEPADWRLRLQQRGGRPGPDGDLDQLLAIVRSADCHAYQALRLAGADMVRLRKLLIERVRERGRERATRGPVRGRSHPGSPSSSSPVRMSSTRRSAALSSRPAPPSPRQSHQHGAPYPAQPEPAPSQREPMALRPDASASTLAKATPAPEVHERSAPRTQKGPAELRSIHPGSLPPLVGRERELATLADALLRRGPRPPLLVGEHGSGRTCVATHLARVLDRPVFRLEAPHYDEDDNLLGEDLELIAEAQGVVVFDDLDRVSSDQPPAMLPALARAWATGQPRILTVVSHESRARLEAWMPGILDTLDVLPLSALEGGDVHQAVKLAAPAVLEQHGLGLDNDAHLHELTRIAERFLTGLAMPGRALDLLDLSCARTTREGRASVGRDTWLTIVCERTGLPRSRVEGSSERDLLDLDAVLARQVVGHEHVLEALASLVRRNRAGFSSGRPIASVLLLGPSGVGKTEIAKALASALYERDDALLRLDMSEYAEAHAVARVVGAPPGYVGHEQGGALTDPLLRNPHRVVLLDEIEKSHRDVHQLLLQVFDEGRLTDGRGRTIDFRHAVVIMTSNLGAELMFDLDLGPNGDGDALPDDAEVLDRARSHFPVELWNRIEAPLVLRPLTREQMLAISRRLIASSSKRLTRDRGIRYRVEDEVLERLIERAGIDPALGARPLRHLIGREVESLVADEILRGRVRAGEEVVVRFDERGALICS